MRTSIINILAAGALAVSLNGAVALLAPSPAAADAVRCPCTPLPKPSFPEIERAEPAAEASEFWVFLWRAMHGW